MPQVPMLRTQWSQDELAALLTAQLAPLGATRTAGALLLALVNQETGSGTKLWNHNIGNITTADDSLDWWSPSTGKAKGLHFRSYFSLGDGVRDFLRFIRARAALWSSIGTGNVSQFAQQIRDSKYNPDLDVNGAAPQLAAFAKQALPRFGTLPAGPAITLTGDGGGTGGGLLVLLLLLFAMKGSKRNG